MGRIHVLTIHIAKSCHAISLTLLICWVFNGTFKFQMTQQLGVFVLLLIILLENGTISAAKDDFSGLDDVFLEQIYRQYGRDDILSGDGFKQLLSDLNIGHSSSKLNKESVLRRISRDVSGIQGYNTTSGFQGNSTLQEVCVIIHRIKYVFEYLEISIILYDQVLCVALIATQKVKTKVLNTICVPNTIIYVHFCIYTR